MKKLIAVLSLALAIPFAQADEVEQCGMIATFAAEVAVGRDGGVTLYDRATAILERYKGDGDDAGTALLIGVVGAVYSTDATPEDVGRGIYAQCLKRIASI